MLGQYLSPEALAFSAFRLGLAVAVLVALALMRRRPRPVAVLAVVVVMHVAAWLFYRAPLQRPYGVGEGSDRTFNLGMAASTAMGHSALEHTQIGHGAPEPFWNALLGLIARGHPGRVPAVYDALTPIALGAVALATARFVRRHDGTAQDEWRGVLIAFAVLSLSSMAVSARPPVPPFWVANFAYKPNHGLTYALAAIALGLTARPRVSIAKLALTLSAMAWVFLLGWAYVVAALALTVVLRRDERPWKPVAAAAGISALAALPYIAHLARDYAPTQAGATARHMWSDPNALLLAIPNWGTLDLGLLLSASIVGMVMAWRQRDPLAAGVLGFAVAGWAIWLVSLPLALTGFAPEPDEIHFFLRYVASLAAGWALARGAEWLSQSVAFADGRAPLAIVAACLPVSVPIAHDPLTMDRYYAESRQPIPPKVLAYADWIAANTAPHAVFVAGRQAAMFIPALTGRRVLLAEAGKLLPSDLDARREAQRAILLSTDEAAARAAAGRYSVTHLAVDEDLMHAFGGDSFAAIAHQPWHRTVFANTAARIVELRWTGAAAPAAP